MVAQQQSPRLIAAGDLLHRKSRRWALFALLALLPTLPCFIFITTIFHQLATLGTGSFMLVGGAWALVLAAGPVLIVTCGLTALFLRVEASVSPRAHRRPLGDVMAVCVAMMISFAPALCALYPPLHALQTGLIGFRGLGQQYPLAGDPYGFWQTVAFWLMGAASLGFLAAVYWRAKWQKHKALAAGT